jgi:hypothetical protein
MGLEFTEMTEDNTAQLEHLLKTVAGTPESCPETARKELPTGAPEMRLPAITDAVSAIDAVIKHFRDTDHLTRKEFLALIRDSQTHSHL